MSFDPIKMRYLLGGACIVFAWLYPYSSGGSRDAMQQMVALGALATASLLFGVTSISVWVNVAFVSGMLLMLSSPNPYWGGKIAGAAGLLLAALAVHVGSNLRRNPAGLPWLLGAIVIAGTLNALEGILQWLGLSGELYQWVMEPERRGLAFGALRQPNLFATFLCVTAVCTAWMVKLRRMTIPMAWFLLTILMLGVAASSSRTGLLEVTLLAVWAWLCRDRQNAPVTRLLIGQFFILMLAMAVLPFAAKWLEFSYISGISRGQLFAQDARLVIWSNAIYLISAHPWTGWGWRETGFSHYATLFDKRFDGLLENIHNLPLQLAVEFGLPITATLFGVVIWVIWRQIPFRIDDTLAMVPISTRVHVEFTWAILLFVIGIHSMLEYPLWYAGFLFLTGVSIGYVIPVTQHGKSMSAYRDWAPRLVQLSAVVLILLAIVAWQQYGKVRLISETPFTNNREAQRSAMKSAIDNASGAWLFQDHLDFAILGWTVVTPQNSFETKTRAEKLLHFSAEPRVIQPLLQSLWYLNDVDALQLHAERYCRAFPAAFQDWGETKQGRETTLIVGRLSERCRALVSSLPSNK